MLHHRPQSPLFRHYTRLYLNSKFRYSVLIIGNVGVKEKLNLHGIDSVDNRTGAASAAFSHDTEM